MKRFFIIFEGIVQGVGFRYTAIQIAHSLGLTGTVYNSDSGNVEVEVQGSQEAIDEFLRQILKERTFIHIYDYSIKKIPLKDGESSFKVIY